MLRESLLLVVMLSWVAVADQVAMPDDASKYHAALLLRPHQTTLFDRFQGAWLDAHSSEELEAFLRAEAEKNGGVSWTLLARYHMRRGQDDAALEALGKALEAMPDDARLLIERGRLHGRLLNIEKALMDLEAARKSEDADLARQAAKMLGKLHLRVGNAEAAVVVWNETLEANPQDENLLEDLVELAAAEGEFEQAFEFLGMLLEMSQDPYRRALRQLRLGGLLGVAGRFDEALETYDKTLAEVGQGSWLERELLAQMVKLFQKDDRIADLREHLELLVVEHGGRLLLHRKLAMLEATAGDVDSAIGRFREILKRSPSEQELRQEFIRMLIDGERMDEAAKELEELITQAPKDSGLWLQMAAMRHRQNDKQQTLAALEKALELMAGADGGELRVAGLMLEYELEEAGVKLLRERMAADDAGPAAMEMLAAYFSGSARRNEALELLTTLCGDQDLETLLRAASSIAALGESGKAYELLGRRREEFSGELRYLSALVQISIAADKAGETSGDGMKMLRLVQGSRELADAVSLVARGMTMAKNADRWIEKLHQAEKRGVAETCLLAELLEKAGDYGAVEALFEGQEEPMLLRYLAAMSERRGEWSRAMETMQRLAASDEGRKASYLKELAELQLRAGDVKGSLATAKRWKQRAPGDKAVWIFTAHLLRQGGDLEQAVRETRQAVARFDGDKDLAASLASLHSERGDYVEAETIYWRMYDDASDSSEQTRWAAQLAQIAKRSRRTAEVELRLIERARRNRKSVGPLLAQAELAKVMNLHDKRRDLLLEAVRLQPTDLDLRIQIATMEEMNGKGERALAILEEALIHDQDQRLRRALARMLVRQGQVIKGLRQLRALPGADADDPRELERLVMSLIQIGLLEEAVVMLREDRMAAGDWRLQYLLAVVLAEDGRELEAVPVFFSLLDTEGDLARTVPLQIAPQADDGGAGNLALIAWYQPIARAHRGNQGMGYGTINLNQLTNDPVQVRGLALAQLLELEKRIDAGIRERLDNVGIKDLEIAREIAAGDADGELWMDLQKKFPDHVGLLSLNLMDGDPFAPPRSLEPEALRRALEIKKVPAILRMSAALKLLELDPGDETSTRQLIVVFDELLERAEGNPDVVGVVLNHAFNVLALEGLAEGAMSKLKNRLRMLIKLKDDEGAYRASDDLRIKVKHYLDPEFDLVKALNQALMRYRKVAALEPAVGTVDGLPLTSLPPWLDRLFGSNAFSKREVGVIDVREVLGDIGRIESPTLRLWLALRTEDAEALGAALKAEAMEGEAWDIALLRLFAEKKQDQVDSGRLFELLLEVRRLARAKGDLKATLDNQLLQASVLLDEDLIARHKEELRALLIRVRARNGSSFDPKAEGIAVKLGFADLAEQFARRRRGAEESGRVQAAVVQSSSQTAGRAARAPSPMERIENLVAAGKSQAAARQARIMIGSSKKNGFNSYGWEDRSGLGAVLGESGVKALMSLTEPGQSKSRTKWMEYVDICGLMGFEEEGIRALEKMRKERPKDTGVAARLAFTPGLDQERAVALLNLAAVEGEELVIYAVEAGNRALTTASDPEACFGFFEVTAAWLEQADPELIESTNTSWVAYFGKGFFGHVPSMKFPSLIRGSSQRIVEGTDLLKRRFAIGKRLVLAMLRHQATAEAGFRLMRTTPLWELADEDLDKYAQTAFLSLLDGHRDPGVFKLVRVISFSGGSLEEVSSWRWLGKHLEEETETKFLSNEFLGKVRKINPDLAVMIKKLVELGDLNSLEEYWDAPERGRLGDDQKKHLERLLLDRVRGLDGALGFVLARLRGLPAAGLKDRIDEDGWLLVKLGLRESPIGNDEQLQEFVGAVKLMLFGEGDRLLKMELGGLEYRTLGTFSSIISDLQLEAADRQRLFSACFRAGIPVGQERYSYLSFYRSLSFANAEEAERFFEKAGLLRGADDWLAPGGLVYSRVYGPAGIKIKVKVEWVLDQALKLVRVSSGVKDELIKRLDTRKQGRFGAIMILSGLSSGEEREKWLIRAFSEPELEGVSDEQLRTLLEICDWLPKGDVVFSKRVGNAFMKKAEEEHQRILELVGKLTKKVQSQSGSGSALRLLRDELAEIIPHSVESALELYLAAEESDNRALARGATPSTTQRNGFRIFRRDSTLSRVLTYRLGGKMDDLPYLYFLAGLLNSPGAGKVSFVMSERGGACGSVSSTTFRRLLAADDGFECSSVDLAKTIIEEVDRADGKIGGLLFVGLMSSFGEQRRFLDGKQVAEIRETLAQMEGSSWAGIGRTMVGAMAWEHLSVEQRQEVREGLVEWMGREDIPAPALMEMIIRLMEKSPDAILELEAMSAFAQLYEDYLGNERSAVTRWAATIFKCLSAGELDEKEEAVAARLLKIFWDNANLPLVAGHSQIPEDLAIDCMVLGMRVKSEVGREILPLLRARLMKNYPMIMRFVMNGEFELAKELLPAVGQSYSGFWESDMLWDENSDRRVAEFGEFLNRPKQMLSLEVNALEFELAKKGESTKMQRSARLVDEFLRINPQESQLRMEVMWLLLRYQCDDLRLTGLAREWASKIDYPSMLRDGMARDGRAMTGKHISEMGVDVYHYAALAAMAEGDISMLKVVLNGQKKAREQGGHRRRLVEFNQHFLRKSCVMLAVMISRGQTEGFAEAAQVFADLAEWKAEQSAGMNLRPGVDMNLAQLMWTWVGEPERYDTWLERMPEELKELRVQTVFPIIRLASFDQRWKADSPDGLRKASMLALCMKPEMMAFVPKSTAWVAELKKNGYGDLVERMAKAVPLELLPALRAPLEFYLGVMAFDRGNLAQAEVRYRQALRHASGKEWELFRSEVRILLLDVLTKLEKSDAADALPAQMREAGPSK